MPSSENGTLENDYELNIIYQPPRIHTQKHTHIDNKKKDHPVGWSHMANQIRRSRKNQQEHDDYPVLQNQFQQYRNNPVVDDDEELRLQRFQLLA